MRVQHVAIDVGHTCIVSKKVGLHNKVMWEVCSVCRWWCAVWLSSNRQQHDVLNISAERWHLCAACNASSDLLSRRPRVDVVSAGCVASNLVHAHVLLLHLQDTHELRMLSKLLHARVDNASGSRSSSGVDQSPGPSSHPNMVLALRFVDVALRLLDSSDVEIAHSSHPTTSPLLLPLTLPSSAAADLPAPRCTPCALLQLPLGYSRAGVRLRALPRLQYFHSDPVSLRLPEALILCEVRNPPVSSLVTLRVIWFPRGPHTSRIVRSWCR